MVLSFVDFVFELICNINVYLSKIYVIIYSLNVFMFESNGELNYFFENK